MKKNICCFFYFVCFCLGIFSFEIDLPYGCEDLYGYWNSALESNINISEARKLKETAIIYKKNLQGIYSPSVSISTQSVKEDSQLDVSSYVGDASVNLLQPLPGGTELGINSSYGFSIVEIDSIKEIVQIPMVNIFLSQSLYPFWLQGENKDPQKLFYENQLNYYENNLKFCILQTVQNVAQYYIYMKIYEYQMLQCDKIISFNEKLLLTAQDNASMGIENKAKITELEGDIWKEINNKNELLIYYEQYKENLKNECGILSLLEKKENIWNFDLNIKDPYLEMLKLQVYSKDIEDIIRKQKNAPFINISIQPEWDLEQIELNNWSEAWKKSSSISWSTSVSINFSDLLNDKLSKQGKIIGNERIILEKQLENYIKTKNNLLSRYSSLKEVFYKQFEQSKELYKKSEIELNQKEIIYNNGEISLLEYESYYVDNENKKYMFYISELYYWLFDFLLRINSI